MSQGCRFKVGSNASNQSGTKSDQQTAWIIRESDVSKTKGFTTYPLIHVDPHGIIAVSSGRDGSARQHKEG